MQLSQIQDEAKRLCGDLEPARFEARKMNGIVYLSVHTSSGQHTVGQALALLDMAVSPLWLIEAMVANLKRLAGLT